MSDSLGRKPEVPTINQAVVAERRWAALGNNLVIKHRPRTGAGVALRDLHDLLHFGFTVAALSGQHFQVVQNLRVP